MRVTYRSTWVFTVRVIGTLRITAFIGLEWVKIRPYGLYSCPCTRWARCCALFLQHFLHCEQVCYRNRINFSSRPRDLHAHAAIYFYSKSQDNEGLVLNAFNNADWSWARSLSPLVSGPGNCIWVLQNKKTSLQNARLLILCLLFLEFHWETPSQRLLYRFIYMYIPLTGSDSTVAAKFPSSPALVQIPRGKNRLRIAKTKVGCCASWHQLPIWCNAPTVDSSLFISEPRSETN